MSANPEDKNGELHNAREVKAENAIFIHSFARTCSTYFFEKFRRDETYAYYEPYNLYLADTKIAASKSPIEQNNARRHAGRLPYFFEYTPLMLESDGVCGFNKKFNTDIYQYKTLADDEQKYIQQLIDYAIDQEKIPVLEFLRSELRVGLQRKAFNGIHILIIRDPFDTCRSLLSFDSLRSYGWGSKVVFEYLKLASSDSIVARLGYSPSLWFSKFRNNTDVWETFCGIFMLFNSIAAVHADFVIDISRIIREPDYAGECSRKIMELTGLAVSFDDAYLPPEAQNAFYNPAPLWDLWEQYLGTEQKKEKLISLAEEFADIPAVGNVAEKMKCIEDCLFYKTRRFEREIFQAEWQTIEHVRSCMNSVNAIQSDKEKSILKKLSDIEDKLSSIEGKLSGIETKPSDKSYFNLFKYYTYKILSTVCPIKNLQIKLEKYERRLNKRSD